MNALICETCRGLVDSEPLPSTCPSCGAAPIPIGVIPIAELDEQQREHFLVSLAARPPSLRMAKGERLLFRGGNPTFHRCPQDDYDFAVSNAAVYFPKRFWFPWRHRPTDRIPMQEIISLEIVVLPRFSVGLIAAIIVSAVPPLLFLLHWLTGCCGFVISLPGLSFGWLMFTVFASLEYSSRSGRYSLMGNTHQGVIRFNTPSDTYADEKLFDLRVLREVLAAASAAGLSDCKDRSNS